MILVPTNALRQTAWVKMWPWWNSDRKVTFEWDTNKNKIVSWLRWVEWRIPPSLLPPGGWSHYLHTGCCILHKVKTKNWDAFLLFSFQNAFFFQKPLGTWPLHSPKPSTQLFLQVSYPIYETVKSVRTKKSNSHMFVHSSILVWSWTGFHKGIN